MHKRATSLYLLAHQDDELCCIPAILEDLAAKLRVVCVFLTSGECQTQRIERRNAETRHVLERLGVASTDIVFAGTHVGILDGELYRKLNVGIREVQRLWDYYAPISKCTLLAWEGGHLDHDASHAIGAIVASQRHLLGATSQIPFYRCSRRIGLLKVNTAIPDNGPVAIQRLGVRARFALLRAFFCYPSQLQVLVFLMPQMTWKWIVCGCLQTQSVSLNRIFARPTAALFYEKRQLLTYVEFEKEISNAFLATREQA
ncbi:MAG: PIG-L family deacetylase [Casimicrobium sp.]